MCERWKTRQESWELEMSIWWTPVSKLVDKKNFGGLTAVKLVIKFYNVTYYKDPRIFVP